MAGGCVEKFIVLKTLVLVISLIFISVGDDFVGFCFNEPVQARHIFSMFSHIKNRDTWGVAFYPDASLQYFQAQKNPLKCKLAQFLTNYSSLKTSIFMGQSGIRAEGHVNAQPFQRELNKNRYSFVFSGNLTNYQQSLPLKRFKPIGNSVGEYLFCYLLGEIEQRNIQSWTKDDCAWFQGILQRANEFGHFSFLFSEGEYLFVYTDRSLKEKLFWLRRSNPYGMVHFVDANRDVDLSTVYPASAHGFMFSSKALTTEQWGIIAVNRLAVFKKGSVYWEAVNPINKPTQGRSHTYAKPTLLPQRSAEQCIRFFLPQGMSVSWELCNLKGVILKRYSAQFDEGYHRVGFNTSNTAFGNSVYLVRFRAGGISEYQKRIVVNN